MVREVRGAMLPAPGFGLGRSSYLSVLRQGAGVRDWGLTRYPPYSAHTCVRNGDEREHRGNGEAGISSEPTSSTLARGFRIDGRHNAVV